MLDFIWCKQKAEDDLMQGIEVVPDSQKVDNTLYGHRTLSGGFSVA